MARRFEENEEGIQKDSPTCMRESIRILLTIASSCRWKICSVDIKAAFLQGNNIDREVFLKPPKEACASGKLWKLQKVVYGLPDASRVWYLRVVEEMKKLGVSVSKYDKAAFYLLDDDIQGMIIVHVDDFLFAGSSHFLQNIIGPLKRILKVSTESEIAFKYVGLNLIQKDGMITMDQMKYIESIPNLLFERTTGGVERSADEAERRNFKGLVGQLNWVAGMTRLDISFNACVMASSQSKPTTLHFKKANKIVRELKSEFFSEI